MGGPEQAQVWGDSEEETGRGGAGRGGATAEGGTRYDSVLSPGRFGRFGRRMEVLGLRNCAIMRGWDRGPS